MKAGEEAKGELPEPQKDCPGAAGASYPRSAVPESSVGSSETPARVALQSPAVLYGCTKLPPEALRSPGFQAYPRHGSGVFLYLSAPTATPLRHCPVLLLLQGSPPSRAGAGLSSGRAEPFASRPNHGAVPRLEERRIDHSPPAQVGSRRVRVARRSLYVRVDRGMQKC